MRNWTDERRPRWLDRLAEINIVVFIVAIYLLETEAGGGFFKAAEVMLVVSAAVVVGRKERLTSGLLLPWAALLLLIACVLLLITQVVIPSEFRSFSVNCVLALAFLQFLYDERRILVALSGLGIAGFLAALSVLAELDLNVVAATAESQAWSLRLGANLPGSNPNIAGMYLAIAFGAALSRALAPSMRRAFRTAWLVCAGVTVLAASLTGSRKAIIYCAVVALVLIVHNNRRLLPVLASAGLIGAWSLFNVPWLYAIIGRRLLGEGDVGGSDTLRAEAVSAALDAFYSAPQGTGWGSSRRFLTGVEYTHINYLEVLVSVGLLGLLVYYSAHALILSGIGRMGPLIRPAVAALMLAGLVLDLFQVTYLYKAPMLVLTIGVAALCLAPNRLPPHPDGSRTAELPRVRPARPYSPLPGIAPRTSSEVQ